MMISFLSGEYTKLKLYFSRLLWLYRAAFRINKSKFLRLFIFSILGIIFQIIFFLVLIFYIKYNQVSINSVLIYEFKRSLSEITLLTACSLAIFFMGAFYQYKSQALSLDVAFSYEKHIKRYFLSDLKHVAALHFFAKKFGVPVLKIFNADTRSACRVLRVSSNLFIPLNLLIFGCFASLLYFPFLSLILSLLALLFIFFQKNISKEVSISSKKLEMTTAEFTVLARSAVGSVEKQIDDKKKNKEISRFLESDLFRNFYYHSEGRLLGQFKAVFVSNIFFILALAIFALYFYGYWLAGFNFDLGELIILLVLARIFLGSIKTIFSRLAVINRFHHSFSRHVEILMCLSNKDWRETHLVNYVVSKGGSEMLLDPLIEELNDDEN